jgi:ribulose-5-phosphate 4-epimerase/fuculose-1-phosphate aldolase
VNRAGFVLHANVHEEHPDIIAMCHAHTTYGTAWCATGPPIDPITQDACAFFEDHVVIGEQGGQSPWKTTRARTWPRRSRASKAALHQNHGLLTASRHSIESAAFWFIALERCCQQQLDIAASGIEPIRIPEDRARYTAANTSAANISAGCISRRSGTNW